MPKVLKVLCFLEEFLQSIPAAKRPPFKAMRLVTQIKVEIFIFFLHKFSLCVPLLWLRKEALSDEVNFTLKR